MSFKKIIGTLHLWLGLGSGLVVFLVSITGCILAFEHEIKSLTLPFLHTRAVPNAEVLPPSTLIRLSESVMEGKKASTVYYFEEGKSVAVRFVTKKPESAFQVYMNPYTGGILEVWDLKNNFFEWIFNGHFNLWIPRPAGTYIVSYGTLIFSILLITGMILWWPKKLTKSHTDKSFKIKWNAKWRRVNYDLHNVPGFYVFFLALALALTGLTFSLDWFFNGFYKIASLGNTRIEKRIEPVSDTTYATANSKEQTIDMLWRNHFQGNKSIRVSITNPSEKSKPVTVTFIPSPGTYYQSYNRYFDQHTGKEFTGKNLFNGHSEEITFGRFLHNISYDIHVGGIGGLPGKVIAFLASLVCASLPVSGFIIWWGRRKKDKPEKKNPSEK